MSLSSINVLMSTMIIFLSYFHITKVSKIAQMQMFCI